MPVPEHSQSAQPNAIALLRALLALGLGWLLLLALAPLSSERGPDRVLIEAELRVGERPPAPVAEVASTKASLRAISARIRAGSQQLLATPTTLAALLLPLRLRELTEQSHVDRTRGQTRRATRCHWPLPRSSCQADDEPSLAHTI